MRDEILAPRKQTLSAYLTGALQRVVPLCTVFVVAIQFFGGHQSSEGRVQVGTALYMACKTR